MLSRTGRPLAQRIFGPIAKVFVRLGISANAVTIAGTVLVVALALILPTSGHPVWAAWLIAAVVVCDSLDGQISRLTGTSSKWGAFLDSTMDRVADAAIFAGVLAWVYRYQVGAAQGLTTWILVGGVGALAAGLTTSYARARAEAVDYSANLGLSERADRLVIILLALWLTGTGWFPWGAWILLVAVWYLFIAGYFTVLQRMVAVYRQAQADPHNLLNSARHGTAAAPTAETKPAPAAPSGTAEARGTAEASGTAEPHGTAAAEGSDA